MVATQVIGASNEVEQLGRGLGDRIPGGRTARIVEEDGMPVITGETSIDDGIMFALIDAGRR